jgi:hypothetical protein
LGLFGHNLAYVGVLWHILKYIGIFWLTILGYLSICNSLGYFFQTLGNILYSFGSTKPNRIEYRVTRRLKKAQTLEKVAKKALEQHKFMANMQPLLGLNTRPRFCRVFIN